MNFIDTLDNSPTDLIGSKYGVVVFAAEDFDDWCESLAIAHDDEVYIASNAYLDDIPDERLTKNGLVRLPVDADGEPIHVGDVLTDGEYTFRVDELAAFGDGSWSIRNEDGNAWSACDVTHHHAPTVEDVLRALTDEVWNRCCEGATASDSGIDELVAECAAKLRLAGEDE